jgi:hypothetical protein
MQHPLYDRYLKVWWATQAQGELPPEQVEHSRFFFDRDPTGKILLSHGNPVPSRFDTFAIVCLLPFPIEFQQTLQHFWEEYMKLLGMPLSYGVLPENRHVELFLFQRPEEVFPREVVESEMKKTLPLASKLKPFTLSFHYPFMTPDGTIVVPGYDEPAGHVENFRTLLRSNLLIYPKKQSMWLHTSLGRILEPLSKERLKSLLTLMEKHWDEPIGTVKVSELMWTHEKQWYMVDKEILNRVQLS